MYNMNIKLLGYKCRLEIVVICVVLGMVIGATILYCLQKFTLENFAVGKCSRI